MALREMKPNFYFGYRDCSRPQKDFGFPFRLRNQMQSQTKPIVRVEEAWGSQELVHHAAKGTIRYLLAHMHTRKRVQSVTYRTI